MLKTNTRVLAVDVGIVNLGICELSNTKNGTPEINRLEVVNILALMGCENLTVPKITLPMLIRMFNIILPILFSAPADYDAVYIEQQNARMSSQRKFVHVSYILYQYFCMFNVHTKLVSASVKFEPKNFTFFQYEGLSELATPARTLAGSTMRKKQYDHRKKYGVECARAFMTHTKQPEAWQTLIQSGTKHDSDLADAFLLALSYYR